MGLAIPGKVISVEEGVGRMAKVQFGVSPARSALILCLKQVEEITRPVTRQ
jgi:hydrogenase maturation factor